MFKIRRVSHWLDFIIYNKQFGLVLILWKIFKFLLSCAVKYSIKGSVIVHKDNCCGNVFIVVVVIDVVVVDVDVVVADVVVVVFVVVVVKHVLLLWFWSPDP